MPDKKLSVFFPLFNEEGNVETIVKKSVEILEKLKLEYEIILINDGSSDKTEEVIDKLVLRNSKIRAIHHPKNLGYGEALKSGFYNAKYDTIVYTDGDNQFDFAEVTKFLEKIDEYDLIVGYRIKRQDPLFRILFKMGWKLSLLAFFRLTLKDADCGFKMIKRKVLEKIPHLLSSRGAMINAELAIKTKKAGFKIGQVGVNHYPRLSGKPTGASLNVIVKSYIDLIRLWWQLKEGKLIFILFLLCLLFALFLRFYRLENYMIFLGDQGRDAIVVKEMWTKQHIPLIGPPTSVGNIYLGPLYYYMMFIPMILTGFNPVAASAMVAVIGVLTVGLIYYLGKIWFGKPAGLVAAFLYSISPITINYSRFSWNPNPLSFFTLVSIFGLYKLHTSGNFFWLILTGASLAFALQMHYLAAILIPICFIIWAGEVLWRKKTHQVKKNLISGTILGSLTFLILMSPLVWFDLRHDYLNYKAVTALFSQSGALKADLIGNIIRIPEIYSQNLIGRYMAGENWYLSILLSGLILAALFFPGWPRRILAIWLLIGLFGISFYQQDIYDHYLGFLNPVPFLLLGSLVNLIRIPTWNVGRYLMGISLASLVIILTLVNLQRNPLNYPPNNQLKKTQEVAKFIIDRKGDEDFNFALLSKNNYDTAYQFYLEMYGYKPKQLPFNKTSQLFVVCEDAVCDPTHSPKYEIAAFGMSKIEWQEEREGVRVYKLIPNPSGKP